MKARTAFKLFAVALLTGHVAAHAQAIPPCRLHGAAAELVGDTVERAAKTYRQIGKTLPFEKIAVNPSETPQDGRTLVILIITDASADGVQANGCASRPAAKDEPLDKLSVLGGCAVVGAGKLELRCSAKAVALFGANGDRPDRANPALLYVLAHELGHVYQRHVGEYGGRAVRIDLSQPRQEKLKALQQSCDPTSTKREEEADALSVEVMKRLLPMPPYREPLLSDRGSLLWNVDKLVLAANEWQSASLEVEFISRSTVHRSFVPTEFPTPSGAVDANARRFVCDVLTGSKGSIQHPLQSATHPSLDQRMGRVAEAIRPVAATLSNDTGRRQFESVARLQSQLSPVFNHIYRETGLYMEAVQGAICTMVKAPTPPSCR